jgi:hypothetical protein
MGGVGVELFVCWRRAGGGRSDWPVVQPSGLIMIHPPNKVTGANAGGRRQLPMRTRWAARVAQFCRWADLMEPGSDTHGRQATTSAHD